MNLRIRLLMGYAAVLVIVFGGFFITFVGVSSLVGVTRDIVEDNYPSVLAAERMVQALQRQQLAIVQVLLGDSADADAELERSHQLFLAWLARARNTADLPGEAAQIDSIERRYEALRDVIEDRSRWASDFPWEEGVPAAFQAVLQACEALRTLNFDAMLEASQLSRQEAEATLWGLGGVGLATVMIGIWVSVSLARRLSEPLEHIVSAAGRIAEGDYTAKVSPGGVREVKVLGQQFNRMAKALHRFRNMDLERVLREQRQSEAVLGSIDDGLIILRHDGTIERVNPVARRQLGLSEVDVAGSRLGAVLDQPKLDEAVEASLRAHSTPGEDLEPVEIVVGEGDARRVLSASAMPIAGSAARRQGALVVVRDITNQKAFEQLRTEFVLRASHELRTPLTGLAMAVGMLAERQNAAPESRERELMETVQEELQRIQGLVNDLFDLSRLHAGRQRPNRQSEAPEHLLERTRSRFALSAQEREIALRMDCAPDLPEIMVDSQQMGRVLDNLVANALRHTPNGGRVSLAAWRRGPRVVLAVSDTGAGIDPAQQSRVFQPFVQIGGGGGGAGLGLAICKEIVQQHSGVISVRSRPDEGATFTVSLPV